MIESGEKEDNQVEDPDSAIMEEISETRQEVEEKKESRDESVPGTSQTDEPDVVIREERVLQEVDFMEDLTLQEAKEKILVLEKKLVREETLRKTAEKHSAALVEQVNSHVCSASPEEAA